MGPANGPQGQDLARDPGSAFGHAGSPSAKLREIPPGASVLCGCVTFPHRIVNDSERSKGSSPPSGSSELRCGDLRSPRILLQPIWTISPNWQFFPEFFSSLEESIKDAKKEGKNFIFSNKQNPFPSPFYPDFPLLEQFCSRRGKCG